MKTQQKRVLQVGSYHKSNLFLGTSEAEHHKMKLLTASAGKAETKVCTAEDSWSDFGAGIRWFHTTALHTSTCTQVADATSYP